MQSKSPEVRTLPIGPSRWGFAWRRSGELSRRGVEERRCGGSGMGSYDVANRYLNLEGLNLFVDPYRENKWGSQ